jgi:hypothetical protein
MIEINTREYQFSHGKRPRGQGYWAFRFDALPELHWSKPYQLYSDAVADARKRARSLGCTEIHVCP